MFHKIKRLMYNFINRKKIDVVFKDLITDFETEAKENRKKGIIDLFPTILAENELNRIIKSGMLDEKYLQIIT